MAIAIRVFATSIPARHESSFPSSTASSPNLNAFAERWVRSITKECLDKMIFFGEKVFGHAVTNFVEHFHTERG